MTLNPKADRVADLFLSTFISGLAGYFYPLVAAEMEWQLLFSPRTVSQAGYAFIGAALGLIVGLILDQKRRPATGDSGKG